MSNIFECIQFQVCHKWLILLGAALENFPMRMQKKKFHVGKKKGTRGEGKKNNLYHSQKLPTSALNDGGQYPPGVIILRCSHRVLSAVAM
jgi:hypothetical protein